MRNFTWINFRVLSFLQVHAYSQCFTTKCNMLQESRELSHKSLAYGFTEIVSGSLCPTLWRQGILCPAVGHGWPEMQFEKVTKLTDEDRTPGVKCHSTAVGETPPAHTDHSGLCRSRFLHGGFLLVYSLHHHWETSYCAHHTDEGTVPGPTVRPQIRAFGLEMRCCRGGLWSAFVMLLSVLPARQASPKGF